MARITAQDAQKRWQTGVQQRQSNYTHGVQNPRHDWATRTTDAIPAMVAGVQAAHHDGRIAAGIADAGTAKWKSRTLAKASNWSSSANDHAVLSRVLTGFTKLFGYLDTADSAISTMPRGTFSENMARSTAYLTSVHNSAVLAAGK